MAVANTAELARSDLISQLVSLEHVAEARFSTQQMMLLNELNQASELALENSRRNLVSEAVVDITQEQQKCLIHLHSYEAEDQWRRIHAEPVVFKDSFSWDRIGEENVHCSQGHKVFCWLQTPADCSGKAIKGARSMLAQRQAEVGRLKSNHEQSSAELYVL